MDSFGVEVLFAGHREQRLDDITGQLGGARLSGYAKMISAAGDLDIEAIFNLPQVFIKLTAKIGKAVIVGGLENDVPRYLNCIQCVI